MSTAGIPELQALNLVLSTKDQHFFNRWGLRTDHFVAYRAEKEFVDQFYKEYGVVPDAITFLSKFQDFDLIDVSESEKAIADGLKESLVYQLAVPAIEKVLKAKEDSTEMVRLWREGLKAVEAELTGRMQPKDLVKQAEARLEEYRKRSQIEGLLGISSGFAGLDQWTHGWLGGETIAVTGYTGEGKSFFGVHQLMEAWLQGKRGGVVSLEMDELLYGWRFDTFLTGKLEYMAHQAAFKTAGLSNTGLIIGHLDKVQPEAGHEAYESYIKWLKQQNPIPFYGASEFRGRKPTQSDIEAIIEEHGLEFLLVDQLSLMLDDERDRDLRKRYINLMHGMMNIFQRTKCVGMILNQANRGSAKEATKGGAKDKTPELFDAAESNAIGEDAHKFIGLKRVEKLMKTSLRKNRIGQGDKELMLLWDVDRGRVREMSGAQLF